MTGREATDASGSTRGFVTFASSGRLYALPAAEIAEVMRLPPSARIPFSPRGLLGLANVRGSVLPLATLKGLLGRGGVEQEGSAWTILLGGSTPLALAVDSVEEIVRVPEDAIATREADVAAEGGERLAGAFKVGDRVAKVLDLPSLLAGAFAAPERKAKLLPKPAGVRAETIVAPAMAGARMLVTFDVAGQEFALDIDAVREIAMVPADQVTVPGADPVVLGVASFRDTLLPLLSLHGLLGLRPSEHGRRRKVVITDVAGATVGLVADDANRVLAAEADRIEPTPQILAARAGGETRIKEIYRDASSGFVSIVATDQLFREEVMQRLASSVSAAPSTDDAIGSARDEELRLLVFKLGGDEFALPIVDVEEEARLPEQITRVPKTPDFLEGVVNLRGDVVPVIDQRRRFAMPAAEAGMSRRLVVVRTSNLRAGLIVDSISEVLRVAASAMEPAPDLAGQLTRLVEGVVNVGGSGRLVMVLDPSELLMRTELGALDKIGKRASRSRKP